MQFYCLVCGDLAPGKMLSSPKEGVADPTLIQSTTATRHGMWYFCVGKCGGHGISQH